MTRPRPSGMVNGVTAAAAFALVAALLWVMAIFLSWSNECPGKPGIDIVGEDKGFVAWPPGSHCYDHGGALYTYEAQPWVKPVIAALLASAVLVLVASVVAAIRERRQSGASVA